MSDLAETEELEALGAALNRVSGVLLAVGELYSPHDDAFSGGNAFAAHAVTTAHGLLLEANYALSALYAKSLERAAQEAQIAASQAAFEEDLAQEQSAAMAVTYAETTESDAAGEQQAEAEESAARAEQADGEEGFAKTYQELLQRLTAVEVFAKDQDMQAMPEAQKKLLPLVEGLREELNKLNRVA